MNAAIGKRSLYKDFLQRVEILKQLDEYEILTIADCLQEESFNNGDIIFRQGEPGDCFYIVKEVGRGSGRSTITVIITGVEGWCVLAGRARRCACRRTRTARTWRWRTSRSATTSERYVVQPPPRPTAACPTHGERQAPLPTLFCGEA